MTVRIRHPHALDGDPREPPSVVPGGSGGAAVDADGTFDAPDAAFVVRLSDAYGLSPARLVVGDPRQLLADGCIWCSEYDGEHVGQHAAAAHPEAWDALQEDTDA